MQVKIDVLVVFLTLFDSDCKTYDSHTTGLCPGCGSSIPE